jgi:hypothetical protein
MTAGVNVSPALRSVALDMEGSPTRSMTNCRIQDAKNWICPDNGIQTIGGLIGPTELPDGSVLLFMPKWKWAKLRYFNQIQFSLPPGAKL